VDLAIHLEGDSSIAYLTLGGNDRIYNNESQILSITLRHGSSSLRELIIDDLTIGIYSFEILLMGIKEHKKLSLIRMENIHDNSSIHMILNFDFIFRLYANNPNF
jgi:hypothetical protein